MRRTIACAAIALAAGCGQSPAPPASKASAQLRPAFGGDFTLTNQDNQRFRLQDIRGRAALLFFGYTSCPDMCPATMSRIAGALERLGDSRGDVVTLFVTVDPTRDSPAVLKQYVGAFRTPLIGLTGTEEEVSRVAAAYHASAEPVPTGTANYLINHTTAIFLIDREGKLRKYFRYDEDPDTLAAALKAVLRTE